MKDIPLCYDGIIRANQIGFKLSKELYEINKEIIKRRKNNPYRW